MSEIYERLRARLDNLATGFPETKSKVEMKILKRLFTEEEAELAILLSEILETPEKAAKRLNKNPEDLAQKMEAMAKKGLLFRMHRGDEVRYAVVPYVVGIFEFQLKSMDSEIAVYMEDYFEEAFGTSIQAGVTPVLRTIPIDHNLVTKWPVAPYENVVEIIDSQKTIAIADCVCRTTAHLAGGDCDKPMETCFIFGAFAHYYVENGMGRYIDKEEAKEIAKKNDEAGLVMQPFNSQKVGGMCSCCGDCCAVLKSLKLQPVPARAVQSNYFAEVDARECSECGTCVERCYMEAIDADDGAAAIDLDRCIGCGLCVTTCPTEAMKLVQKPEYQLYEPPKNGIETYLNIMRERGKI